MPAWRASKFLWDSYFIPSAAVSNLYAVRVHSSVREGMVFLPSQKE
ncbi:hypothetical protein AGROH133_12208 [Agrobacterium tumefaciens]|nr:hypothetical protein AGROH133_12208 [Agrobacterium tumefaciens]